MLYNTIKMLNRKIISRLEQWAASATRKPLILRGARQVGKTVAVNMFGKQFDHFIPLNLDLPPESEIFKRSLPINDLFQAILLKKGISSTGGKTLLFLDEVQNSPEAVASLRYFYEKLPHIYVVAAGSLLEIITGKKQIPIPVGRVEYAFMYPLSFREFLVVSGGGPAIEAFDSVPLPEFALPALFELFHRYTLIGGMPEIVARYMEENDVAGLGPVYNSLLTSYLDDVEKYARNPTMANILRHCIESAPFEAGKRIKFAGFGNSNYRSREVGEALRALERAQLIRLLNPSTAVEIPIRPDMKKSPRLQFLDTGLVNYFVGLQEQYFKHEDLSAIYRGLITEHITGQELICSQPNTLKKQCFWVREKTQSNAEVDFLIQHGEYAIPVETKAGKAGRLRSLHQFIDRSPHKYAVRLYYGPVLLQKTKTPAGKPYQLLNLPYFLASKVHEYLDWMLSDEL